MKILHVITSLRIGGAEKLMVDLLPNFKNKGCDIDLLIFDGVETPFKRALQEKGIRILEFGRNGFIYNPFYIFRLMFIMKSYDIVHTHNTAPQLFCAIANVLCSVVLITTEHNTSNRRRNLKWYKCIDKWMYTKYKKVICISEQAEINLRAYLGNNYSKIQTIYNGIDTSLFMNAQQNIQIINEYPDVYKIFMVAGFRYQKDQKTLIKAISLLSDKYHLFFVGDGTKMNECMELSESLSISKRVHFLGIRTDIPHLLKSADVIVMSSHFEGMSLSNIEGMSAGKPFIASNVDGLREVTAGAGLLFEHENSEELANIIENVISNKKLYNEIASRCLNRAKEYDITKMIDSYLSIYFAVLNGKA